MTLRNFLVPLLVALLVAALVYGVMGYRLYEELSAHQPHGPAPFAAGTTSFPPSTAWFWATPAAILAFFITLPLVALLRRLC